MKRINPDTLEPFKSGDKREDGFLFHSYDMRKTDKTGKFYENWKSPESYKNRMLLTSKTRSKVERTKSGHVTIFLRSAKKRAKNKNIPFDLDKDYLLSIATDRCPIFNTEFSWGITGRGITPEGPSLDRVIPELGYVKGNVVFISNIANTIKQNVTEKELYAVADWLHDKRKEVLNAFKDTPARLPAPPDTPGKRFAARWPVLGPGPG